jgi:hypothetical protein
VRLHVREGGTEQLFRAIDRERFHLIDVFAAAVVALGRIAFGVLVRKHRALRLQHARTRVVFRRDQFDVIFLPLLFVEDRLPHCVVVAGNLHFRVKHEGYPQR